MHAHTLPAMYACVPSYNGTICCQTWKFCNIGCIYTFLSIVFCVWFHVLQTDDYQQSTDPLAQTLPYLLDAHYLVTKASCTPETKERARGARSQHWYRPGHSRETSLSICWLVASLIRAATWANGEVVGQPRHPGVPPPHPQPLPVPANSPHTPQTQGSLLLAWHLIERVPQLSGGPKCHNNPTDNQGYNFTAKTLLLCGIIPLSEPILIPSKELNSVLPVINHMLIISVI